MRADDWKLLEYNEDHRVERCNQVDGFSPHDDLESRVWSS